MELIWSKRLSVANELIDTEHKKILGLVNELEEVIKEKNSVLFMEALTMLEDITRLHFSNEEKIAQAIQFVFDDHNLEHQYILGEFRKLIDALEAGQGRWSESLAEHYFMFLSTWAVDHVLEDDMKMKATLEKFPYDFKPVDIHPLTQKHKGKQ